MMTFQAISRRGFVLALLLLLISFPSFAGSWGAPHTRRIVRGVVQPAQYGWESHQECRKGGQDPVTGEYYTSVLHLTCAGARDVIRHSHYGNNRAWGKFYKCDNGDVPAISVLLSSDEDIRDLVEPDYSCPDHNFLRLQFLETREGPCVVGWICVPYAGGT